MEIKCEFEGCQLKGQFGIFCLHQSGTKEWHHYCDHHDKLIDRQNRVLRKQQPKMVWKEVKVK